MERKKSIVLISSLFSVSLIAGAVITSLANVPSMMPVDGEEIPLQNDYALTADNIVSSENGIVNYKGSRYADYLLLHLSNATYANGSLVAVDASKPSFLYTTDPISGFEKLTLGEDSSSSWDVAFSYDELNPENYLTAANPDTLLKKGSASSSVTLSGLSGKRYFFLFNEGSSSLEHLPTLSLTYDCHTTPIKSRTIPYASYDSDEQAAISSVLGSTDEVPYLGYSQYRYAESGVLSGVSSFSISHYFLTENPLSSAKTTLTSAGYTIVSETSASLTATKSLSTNKTLSLSFTYQNGTSVLLGQWVESGYSAFPSAAIATDYPLLSLPELSGGGYYAYASSTLYSRGYTHEAFQAYGATLANAYTPYVLNDKSLAYDTYHYYSSSAQATLSLSYNVDEGSITLVLASHSSDPSAEEHRSAALALVFSSSYPSLITMTDTLFPTAKGFSFISTTTEKGYGEADVGAIVTSAKETEYASYVKSLTDAGYSYDPLRGHYYAKDLVSYVALSSYDPALKGFRVGYGQDDNAFVTAPKKYTAWPSDLITSSLTAASNPGAVFPEVEGDAFYVSSSITNSLTLCEPWLTRGTNSLKALYEGKGFSYSVARKAYEDEKDKLLTSLSSDRLVAGPRSFYALTYDADLLLPSTTFPDALFQKDLYDTYKKDIPFPSGANARYEVLPLDESVNFRKIPLAVYGLTTEEKYAFVTTLSSWSAKTYGIAISSLDEGDYVLYTYDFNPFGYLGTLFTSWPKSSYFDFTFRRRSVFETVPTYTGGTSYSALLESGVSTSQPGVYRLGMEIAISVTSDPSAAYLTALGQAGYSFMAEDDLYISLDHSFGVYIIYGGSRFYIHVIDISKVFVG
jgi:hypothetical protein